MTDEQTVETTERPSDSERQERRAVYAGKRFYSHLIDLQNAIHAAKQEGVTDAELGTFAGLDLKPLIAEAVKIGEVPDWRTAPKFEYTRVVYDRK